MLKAHREQQVDILRKVKQAIRDRYAWPGGYALVAYMSDGLPMCLDCVRKEWRLIYRDTLDDSRSGWAVVGVDVYWEGPTEQCCHCNKELPSEYGDPWAEEEDEDLLDANI